MWAWRPGFLAAATESGGLVWLKPAGGEQLPKELGESVTEVIFRNPSPAVRAIPANQIASRQRQKFSLLPDSASLGLTPQELVHLVEFLMADEVSETGRPRR